MSVKITTKIWDLRGLTAATRLVLIKIADCADDDGRCWPSIPMIMEDCELSDRTVQNAIAWAEERGILRREMRSGKRTIYYVTPENFSPLPPKNIPPEKSSPPKLTTSTPEKSSGLPPKLTTSTPEIDDIAYKEEPSIDEPSIEQPSIGEPSTCGREKNKNDTEPIWFAAFWENYPKQRIGNRAKALAAYRSALTRSPPEEIHAGTVRYAQSDEVQRGFAKGAAAWLNDDRWKTDYSIRPSGHVHGAGNRKEPASFVGIAIDLANREKRNRDLQRERGVFDDPDNGDNRTF